jgi:hypothetical protein
MAGYIVAPVAADPNEIARDVFTFLAANIPGYVPAEGNLDALIVEGVAAKVAEAMATAGGVTTDIFRYFGQSLVGLPPIDAAPAHMATTWAVNDTLGYVIPAGTVVSHAVTGDRRQLFFTPTPVAIPPGNSTVTVDLVAVESGTDGNGLPPASLVLAVPLSFVSSVVSTSTTSGGADAEDTDAYLNRLSDELRLLSPRPILAADFSTLARRVPGVARALAIDGLDPVANTLGNERMVAVAVVDVAGAALSADVKAQVRSLLQARREVNFVVSVIDPTFTAISVAYVGQVLPGANTSTVTNDINAAVAAYLDPSTWAADSSPVEWRPKSTVRLFEVAALINSVVGFDFLTSLTLNGGTADVVLTGRAPLPTPGTIGGTVV